MFKGHSSSMAINGGTHVEMASYNTSTVNVSNSTATTITYTEAYNNSSNISYSGGVFTLQPGKYQISCVTQSFCQAGSNVNHIRGYFNGLANNRLQTHSAKDDATNERYVSMYLQSFENLSSVDTF